MRSSMFKALVACLCLAAFIYAIPSLSPKTAKQPGAVVGWTLDPAGKPVPSATITIRDSSGRSSALTTEPDGAFAFGSVHPGEARISAAHPDLGRAGRSITVNPGRVVSTQIRLQPPASAAR